MMKLSLDTVQIHCFSKTNLSCLIKKITVEKIEYENQVINNDKIYVKTLSPITVYSTVTLNSSKKNCLLHSNR